MPEFQYLYSAEGSDAAYCFISTHCAEAGDLIEHDGEIFTITKRALWWPSDDLCDLISDFIQFYPADSFYSLAWQRNDEADG